MRCVMAKSIFVAIALMAYAPNANAFNFIYLEGKGVGGKMSCSDWKRVTKTRSGGEGAAMMQWFSDSLPDMILPFVRHPALVV
jgi:hypothetical protein